ncbi:MAG: tRNA 2-thiocytidine biosynthesis TtcA family protein [Bacteroidales bacterium]|nr:tRNA 2-thiocytidine biosynthesis TtcA family protein [Bacteroidales bacterium]
MSNLFNNNFDTKQKRFVGDVRTLFNNTIEEYHLIKENDKIAVGLSGGKDSMTLLHLFAFRKKYLQKNFEFDAVYVNVENADYKINFDQVKEFCDNLEVKLIVRNVLLNDERNAENRCFICSLARRKNLFDFTKELGYNKLALGHNMDDAVETLMMNMVYHGKYCSIPPYLSMFDGRLSLIRPLLKVTKEQTFEYSVLHNFPQIKSECGFEHLSARNKFRNFADYLEKLNRGAKKNIFSSMSNIYEDYIVK